MTSKNISTLIVSGLSAAVLAGDGSLGSPVTHLGHEKVAAAFAKGGPLVITDRYKVQTGNRSGPGEVEIHERDTDIFYILEGSATFVTGGQAMETKSAGPGEQRAQKISGGQERHLAKGDVIVSPKRVPHWFKEVQQPMLYYVVKVAE